MLSTDENRNVDANSTDDVMNTTDDISNDGAISNDDIMTFSVEVVVVVCVGIAGLMLALFMTLYVLQLK